MHPLLALLLLSVAIGLWGRNRAFGFWGFFLLSLLLTPPIVALLLLLTATPARERAA
jgi:hypothetical protein